jgi:hypothetical protein
MERIPIYPLPFHSLFFLFILIFIVMLFSFVFLEAMLLQFILSHEILLRIVPVYGLNKQECKDQLGIITKDRAC